MPLKWKDLVERDKPTTFEAQSTTIAELLTKTGVAKWAYNLLFNDNSLPDKAILKWVRDLGVPRNFCWETAFKNIYNTSDDISLRWLQFRIIHRIIPTNKLLKLFGIIQSISVKDALQSRKISSIYSIPAQRYWSYGKT